jgi:hypothetical protein
VGARRARVVDTDPTFVDLAAQDIPTLAQQNVFRTDHAVQRTVQETQEGLWLRRIASRIMPVQRRLGSHG